MTVTYLNIVQVVPTKYTFRRRYADTSSKKAAVKLRIGVITGIILVGKGMHLVWRKILCRCLVIIPVKRRNGKEWCDLIGHLEVGGVRLCAPTIGIITIV